VNSVVKFFQSTVPTEGTLQQLEEASTKSDEKMLQLGNALMSGVHGWPQPLGDVKNSNNKFG